MSGEPRGAPRTVLFHRNFQRFQGGHLKLFHYFEHVRHAPGFRPLIRFSADSVWDASNPWTGMRELAVGADEPLRADVLFLAGMDWRWLEPAERARPPAPVINLLQALRHAHPGDPAYEFLKHPAIRICVSAEIEQALAEDARVRGPVFTVPVAIDLESLPAPRPRDHRDIECVVLAMKDRPLGRAVAQRISRAGHGVLLLDEPVARAELLDALARAEVSVHITKPLEGAYLPAVESMALGALVVCPDAVGNRAFCRDGDTCLVPEREERAIAEAALVALTAQPQEREPLLAAALAESRARDLAHERARFIEILTRADALWAEI
jgi:hypothetical protein